MTKKRSFRVIAIAASMALVVSMIPSIAFAGDNSSMLSVNVVSVKDDGQLRDDLNISDGRIEFRLPTTGNGKVTMEIEDIKIRRSIPKVFAETKGYQFQTGEVVYATKDGSAKLAIEDIQEVQGGESFESLHQSIIIQSEEGIREYSQNYTLPEGYYLIKAEEYYANDKDAIEANEDCIFIINDKEEIIDVIELGVATDADGKSIAVNYEIEENQLIQAVDADEDVHFPIIIPLVDHPNKKKEVTLTYSGTQKIINQIQSDIDDANNLTGSFTYWVVNGAAGIVFGAYGLALDGITTWIVKSSHINRLTARKSMYETEFDKMRSVDGLSVITTLKWQRHGSNDGRYVIYKEFLNRVIAV